MLIISVSNGLFTYNENTKQANRIIKKESFGAVFGIDFAQDGSVIVGSREFLGTEIPPDIPASTGDAIVYTVNTTDWSYRKLAEIHQLYGLHGLCVDRENNVALITSSGKNMIYGFSLDTLKVIFTLKIGEQRHDVNHINAVWKDQRNDSLYVGLGNHKYPDEKRNSELLVVPNFTPMDKNTTLYGGDQHGSKIISLGGVNHSHDIVPYKETILVSDSKHNRVYSVYEKKFIITVEDRNKEYGQHSFVRGLAVEPRGIWVGSSGRASRETRHHEYDGIVQLFAHDTYELLETVKLPEVGQVHALLYMPE